MKASGSHSMMVRILAGLMLGTTLASAVSAAVYVAPALAQNAAAAEADDEGEAQTGNALEQRALFWEKQGRPDKAADAWEQVLKGDPSNARALITLTKYYATRGDTKRARLYLERLERAHPTHASIPSLRKAVDLGASFQQRLGAARSLAKAGKYKEAVYEYDQVLGDPPADEYAYEYYMTLSAVDGQMPRAREGLRGLVARYPRNNMYQLGYGRLLTYEEATRRDGIRRLEALNGMAKFGREADAARRDALLWLGARENDRPYYANYLKVYPTDEDVRRKMNGIAVRNPYSDDLAQAYAALDRDELDLAEERFLAILARNPNDVDALVGLGSIRLKQKRFEDARDLLRKAKALAPSREATWGKALAAAEFWCYFTEAERLKSEGNYIPAEENYKRAIAVSPADAPIAKLALGYLYLSQQRPEEAEVIFREMLSAKPDDIDALRGLFMALLRQRKIEEAAQYEAQLLARPNLTDAERTEIRLLIVRARAALAAEDEKCREARSLYDEALTIAPDSKSLRLEVGYLSLNCGDLEIAARLSEQLLRDYGNDTQVLPYAALVEFAHGRKVAGLEYLSRIPPEKLSASLAHVKDMTIFELQCERAVKLWQDGRERDSKEELSRLERLAGVDGEKLATVALAWSQAGHQPHAENLARQVLRMNPKAPRSARMTCEWVLFAGGERQEREFRRVLGELEAEPNLTKSDLNALAGLRKTYELIRLVPRDIQAEEYTTAYSRIERWLKRDPNDRMALAALADLYLASGEPKKGHDLYERLLKDDRNNIDLIEKTAIAAVKAEEYERAEVLTDRALRKHPHHPRAYLLAGRVELQFGNDGPAADRFKEGLRISDENRAYRRRRLEDLGTDPEAAQRIVDEQAERELSDEQAALLSEARARFGTQQGQAFAANTNERPVSPAIEDDLHDGIASIDARYAPSLGVEFIYRHRAGTPGRILIHDFSMPITGKVSPGYYGQFVLRATPIYLNSTHPGFPESPSSPDDTSGPNAVQSGAFSWGSTAAVTGATARAVNGNFSDNEIGVQLQVGYNYRGFYVEVGSTPLGFPVMDVQAKIGWVGSFGQFTFGIGAFRNLVTDSVLSYAGARDPFLKDEEGNARTWGGVRNNGLKMDFAYDWGRVLWYMNLSYGVLTGRNTDLNHGGNYGTGVLWTFYENNHHSLTTGLNTFFMNYADNQFAFTYGNGGYFSPQFFFVAPVPLTYRYTAAKVRAMVSGDVGPAYFTLSDAPYFPNDPALQTASGNRFHNGFDRIGPSFGAQADVDWNFARGWWFGAGLKGQFAIQYNEVWAFLRLRHDFLMPERKRPIAEVIEIPEWKKSDVD